MPTDDAASDAVVVLDEQFARAVEDACALHRTQTRKGTDVPVRRPPARGGGAGARGRRHASARRSPALLHDAIEDTRRDAEADPQAVRAQGGAHRRGVHRRRPSASPAKTKKPRTRRGQLATSGRCARSNTCATRRPRSPVLRVKAADALAQRAVDRRRPPALRTRDLAALQRRRGRPALVLPLAVGRALAARSPACSATSCASPCASWRSWPAGGSTSATRKPVAERKERGHPPDRGE